MNQFHWRQTRVCVVLVEDDHNPCAVFAIPTELIYDNLAALLGLGQNPWMMQGTLLPMLQNDPISSPTGSAEYTQQKDRVKFLYGMGT